MRWIHPHSLPLLYTDGLSCAILPSSRSSETFLFYRPPDHLGSHKTFEYLGFCVGYDVEGDGIDMTLLIANTSCAGRLRTTALRQSSLSAVIDHGGGFCRRNLIGCQDSRCSLEYLVMPYHSSTERFIYVFVALERWVLST